MHPKQTHSFLKAKPFYEINRVRYSADLEVYFGVYGPHYDEKYANKPYVHVSTYTSGLGGELTDSARKKLSEWILANKDEILTPLFLAQSSLHSAHQNTISAQRAMDTAKQEYEDAKQRRRTMLAAEKVARDALKKIQENN